MVSARVCCMTVAALLVVTATACAHERPSPGPLPAPSPTEAPIAALGTGPRFVAMGDSAAAAPLVPHEADPAGCLKSTNDYPSVLARRIDAAERENHRANHAEHR